MAYGKKGGGMGYGKKGYPEMKMKGDGLMKSHGNVEKVKYADNQKFDMGRCQKIGHEMKGHLPKAFNYKY